MKFSVLMSIYFRENPDYFHRAMQSIWDEQTVKPDEIVLVLDGNLTDELYETVNYWKNRLELVFKVVPLDENVGLGQALNYGLNICQYDLIARMDTDDISMSSRFEKQLKVFNEKDIDVCGAFISEFEDDENDIVSYRVLPAEHDDIVSYGKMRSPMNHASVMYKKSSVVNAGSYMHMLWMEDYYLWARMILNGAKFYNIQEPLLNVRAGNDMLSRRGGLDYAKSEFRLLSELKRIGFLTLNQYLINVIIKMPIRLMPKVGRKLIYKFLRSKGKGQG